MQKSGQPIIVIGHKNPDTDSICSAIAYAHLKNDFLGIASTPFRAGNLNQQTGFVLSRFGVENPDLLTDVYPKIADIMIKDVELITLTEKDTLGCAQDIIIKNSFSFLPVVDSEGKYLGQITALQLAGLPQEIAGLCRRERISIDPEKFLKSVGGSILTGGSIPPCFSGRLFIKGISENPEPDESNHLAFITSYDEGVLVEAMKKGLSKKGLSTVVVCGGEKIDRNIVELAGREGVCLVASPGDLLSTIVSILLAMPIKGFIDRQHPTFKHYELVRKVQREIGRYNEGGFIVLDDDGFIHGVITRINFLNQSRFRVIMVDHNEFAQGVDGIEEADVVEIIDHHRLGNRNTDAPITFINKVVGSTATIISELYRNFGFTPNSRIAGLMLAAILSDTVILKSPTTTGLDRDMSKWLASVAGIDIEEFGEEMIAAGSALEGLDPEQIIKQDMKIYTEGEWKFSISQIEIVGFKIFYEMKNMLAEKLQNFMNQAGCNFACLMATDITREISLLLCAGGRRIVEAITYPRVEENIFEMKAVLSRKKQVLPYLLDLIRRL